MGFALVLVISRIKTRFVVHETRDSQKSLGEWNFYCNPPFFFLFFFFQVHICEDDGDKMLLQFNGIDL
jgi:hypothetical protein